MPDPSAGSRFCDPCRFPGASFVVSTGGRKMTRTRKIERLLWTAQALLAGLFLFAGAMKLMIPMDVLAAQAQMPGLFLRFIAVAEVLGATGLILPVLLRVWPALTPVAA